MVRRAAVVADLTRVTENALIVPQVWRRLLETVIVGEGGLDLVHVQASVQMVQAVLLKILIE